MDRKVVKLKVAMEMLSMSDSTLRRKIKKRVFKAYRINDRGDYGIPIEEIERYLMKRQVA